MFIRGQDGFTMPGTGASQYTDWILRLHRALGVLGVLGVAPLFGQTTQGLISGSIINSVTGKPIAGASVAYSSTVLAASGTVRSDSGGFYFLPLLSAGTYSIRTTGDGYQ